MEWKEHVAWLAPISITMAAAVFIHYGRNLKRHPQLRNAVLAFVWFRLLPRASPASSAPCSTSTRRFKAGKPFN